MPIITVTSGKGGVGKSTAALALASALRKLGALRVIIIDLDYGASVTRSYRYPPESAIASAVLNGDMALEDGLHETEEEGVLLLPTSAEIKQVPDSQEEVWLSRLRAIGENDVIVIDTSDDIMSAPVAAAIRAANVLVIPVILAEKAYQRTYPEVAGILAATGHRPAEVWFVNMIESKPKKKQLDVLNQLTADGRVIAAQIGRSIFADEADDKGKSIVAAFPGNKVSKAFVDLARTVLAELKRTTGYSLRPAPPPARQLKAVSRAALNP